MAEPSIRIVLAISLLTLISATSKKPVIKPHAGVRLKNAKLEDDGRGHGYLYLTYEIKNLTKKTMKFGCVTGEIHQHKFREEKDDYVPGYIFLSFEDLKPGKVVEAKAYQKLWILGSGGYGDLRAEDLSANGSNDCSGGYRGNYKGNGYPVVMKGKISEFIKPTTYDMPAEAIQAEHARQSKSTETINGH